MKIPPKVVILTKLRLLADDGAQRPQLQPDFLVLFVDAIGDEDALPSLLDEDLDAQDIGVERVERDGHSGPVP